MPRPPSASPEPGPDLDPPARAFIAAVGAAFALIALRLTDHPLAPLLCTSLSMGARRLTLRASPRWRRRMEMLLTGGCRARQAPSGSHSQPVNLRLPSRRSPAL